MRSAWGMALLLLRGVALWVMIPATVLAYPVIARRRHPPLGQALGWADLNLIAALHRRLPRNAFTARQDFVPLSEMGSVTHRIGAAGPA
jgi:hypothetical protein